MHSIKKQVINDLEFTLIEVNQPDIDITFLDYGATIYSIHIPNKDGVKENVVLTYDKLESYIDNDIYLNAIIGPTSGRIANAEFQLNNRTYTLEKNFMDTENLHGGSETFARVFFEYKIFDEENQTQVIFTYRKQNHTSYYPGTQEIKIVYTIKDGNLAIEFIADTDSDTLLNMTNHAYFNLSGNNKDLILNHQLEIKTNKVIELNDKFAPTKLKNIDRDHLDFKQIKPISDNFFEGITSIPEKGIDNPYYFENTGLELKQISLLDPVSKRQLEVYTTYPCIVVYTHNHPDKERLEFNKEQVANMAICFETQNAPNGINVEGVEDSILREDETYYHKTLYKFTVKE